MKGEIKMENQILSINDPRVIKAVLKECIAKLNLEERVVMRRLYGLNGKDPQSYEEVAKELLMTDEKVKKIEIKALRKLRK